MLEGASSAKVTVKMKNQGETAFEPEIWGKSITIERRMMGSTGASSYKLYAADGTVVDTKRQRLEAICTSS